MAQFIFAACRAGSEAPLKREMARNHPELRFAFSRPGFVTFRITDDASRTRPFELDSVFARTWGYSLGKIVGPETDLARSVWTAVAEQGAGLDAERAAHLHVWPRDIEAAQDVAAAQDLAGAPGPTPESRAIGERILAQRGAPGARTLRLNEHATPGDIVLDCVLVEPREWWLGWHRANRLPTCWPGGTPQIPAPPDMISRAYLKMTEALLWSELPLESGDRCVEIGSAPGGASAALLERGCEVTGIDPAAMDARVLAHPRFTHVRARAKDLKRSAYSEFRWLFCDANVAPNYTLDTIEAVVTDTRVRLEGLVLTLKLTKAELADALPSYRERVRSWGYAEVRARQLAFNRAEVCLAARRREPPRGTAATSPP